VGQKHHVKHFGNFGRYFPRATSAKILAVCTRVCRRRWRNLFYNITKAKRAFWLVNLAFTICPWVCAADVCANVYKANPLTDIVSKVMADVLLPEMRNCLQSCVKMKLYRVAGVQSVVMIEFSRACFLLSCKTTRTFFLWCSSIKGLLLFQCLNVML